MKALTIRQPWASLIAIGAKRIETRSWATNYRGPLAIHASAKCTRKLLEELAKEPPFARAIKDMAMLPLGCVIATVDLVDCILISDVMDHYFKSPCGPAERAFGDFTQGRYMWMLENVVPLKPMIRAKGSLGLWNWEPSE